MRVVVLWGVIKCNVEIYRRFGGIRCAHRQDRRVFCSSMKMKMPRSSEMAVNFYQTTQRVERREAKKKGKAIMLRKKQQGPLYVNQCEINQRNG